MEETTEQGIVFVVDDDPAIRSYLEALIQSVQLRPMLYESAPAFLDAYQGEGPACLLLDVRMPGVSGFDLQEELGRRRIDVPVIMMTGFAEVPMAVRAMRAGAIDFIQKPFDGQELLDRIQEAIASDRAVRSSRLEQASIQQRLERLTPRQRDVLKGVLAGKSSKEIAFDLELSPKTVDVHRFRIMQQMQAQSLPDLFRLVTLAQGQKGL